MRCKSFVLIVDKNYERIRKMRYVCHLSGGL